MRLNCRDAFIHICSSCSLCVEIYVIETKTRATQNTIEATMRTTVDTGDRLGLEPAAAAANCTTSLCSLSVICCLRATSSSLVALIFSLVLGVLFKRLLALNSASCSSADSARAESFCFVLLLLSSVL